MKNVKKNLVLNYLKDLKLIELYIFWIIITNS